MAVEYDDDGNVYSVPDEPAAKPVAEIKTQDIAEMARSELPRLVAHAIKLAHDSEKLSEVVSVIRELGDRGYGKAPQAMEMRATVDHNHKIDDSTKEMLDRFAEWALRKRGGSGQAGAVGTDRASDRASDRHSNVNNGGLVIDVKPTATIESQDAG